MKIFKLRMKHKRMIEGYIFILPWILGTAVFYFNPLIRSVQLSFQKMVSITGFNTEWIGIENFVEAFTVDIEFVPLLVEAISNTLINTPLIIVFSLFIAMLLNTSISMRGFFRAVFLLPVVLGTGFIMQQLLGQEVNAQVTEMARGILLPESVLAYLSPTVKNLIQSFLDKITIILWHSGVQIIIFLGALQSVPRSLYESAKCDSATEWEMFWLITFPVISPVILLNIVYTIVDSFTDVQNPIVISVIDLAFKKFRFGYASSIAWIYLVFVFLLIGLVFLIFNLFWRKSKINH